MILRSLLFSSCHSDGLANDEGAFDAGHLVNMLEAMMAGRERLGLGPLFGEVHLRSVARSGEQKLNALLCLYPVVSHLSTLNGLDAEALGSYGLPLDEGKFLLASCSVRVLIEHLDRAEGITNDPIHFVFSVQWGAWSEEEFQQAAWGQLVLPVFMLDPTKRALLDVATSRPLFGALDAVSGSAASLKHLLWTMLQHRIFMDYNYRVLQVWKTMVDMALSVDTMQYYCTEWLEHELRARARFQGALEGLLGLLDSTGDGDAELRTVHGDLRHLVQTLNWATLASAERVAFLRQTESIALPDGLSVGVLVGDGDAGAFEQLVHKYAPSRMSALVWSSRFRMCRWAELGPNERRSMQQSIIECQLPVFDAWLALKLLQGA